MNEELQNEQGDFEINLDKNYKPKKKIHLEQEEHKPIKFKTAFWSVLGVHVFALAGIGMYSAHSKAQAAMLEEDKKALSEPVPAMVGVDNPVVASAPPAPSPTPAKVENVKATPNPKPKVVEKIPQNANQNYPTTNAHNPKFTGEYVVKQGDTFTSIVKKYKLNGEKLKKLNGIKDENKLILGQKLKFM